MAEWRTGRTLGVTLYRDEVFVGHVCSAMVAAEIVETMNRVGRLLAEVRAAPGHTGTTDCCTYGCPPARDAQRRSEATPQNAPDLARLDPYDTAKGFTPGFTPKNGEHPE